jgi:hypothetical protein
MANNTYIKSNTLNNPSENASNSKSKTNATTGKTMLRLVGKKLEKNRSNIEGVVNF